MSVQSITLVRHGRVVGLPSTPIPAGGFAAFVERYRAAGIDCEHLPPEGTCDLAKSAGVLTCSDLRRSIESANMLVPHREPIQDTLFREVEIPVELRAPFRFRPSTWAIWARLLWFVGVKHDCESFIDARRRSQLGATRLEGLANDHKTVVLVGHGIFNLLVARELRRRGWRGPRIAPPRHWGSAIYVRAAP